ncbi:hypothetical protein [Salinibaculum rarum]|uniref:hypothetical protein n=1 Tax=Salinibaculum rarum TaxID=3058903 RepID=UPI002660290E|nr:hypothetical protein [Salinibaculum sp. KK48]
MPLTPESRPPPEKLTTRLQNLAEDRLLAVVTFTAEAYTPQYLAPVIENGYSDTELEETIQSFRRQTRLEADRGDTHRAGDHYGSVHLYDDALVLLFSHPSDYNVLVAYDPHLDVPFIEFFKACVETLNESTPDRAPASTHPPT